MIIVGACLLGDLVLPSQLTRAQRATSVTVNAAPPEEQCQRNLDWSERRYHLAGHFGAALATRLLEKRWIERAPEGRALTITKPGIRGLRTELSIELPS